MSIGHGRVLLRVQPSAPDQSRDLHQSQDPFGGSCVASVLSRSDGGYWTEWQPSLPNTAKNFYAPDNMRGTHPDQHGDQFENRTRAPLEPSPLPPRLTRARGQELSGHARCSPTGTISDRKVPDERESKDRIARFHGMGSTPPVEVTDERVYRYLLDEADCAEICTRR